MILRTRLALSSAARPVSPLPALLLTMVSSRAPCSMSASISADGYYDKVKELSALTSRIRALARELAEQGGS